MDVEIGDKLLWTENGAIGEVEGAPGGLRLAFQEEIPDRQIMIKWEELRKLPICEGEHEEFLYSDKEEKWVCPICDL